MAVILSIISKFNLIYAIIFASLYSAISLSIENSTYEKQQGSDKETVWLNPNEPYVRKDDVPFKIYCFQSISKSSLQLWRSVHLIFENVPLSYELFPGVNVTDIREKYDAHSIWYPTFWISGQKTAVEFPAFSQYCVGIVTKEKYAIYLHVRTVNYWRVLQTALGVLLYLSAPSLSRNPFFHYTSAVSLGVLGSLLVLIYVFSRFIPKKSTSYAVLLFGFSSILYLTQIIWRNMNDIISNYMDVLLAYCFCAAIISFLVCYRLGPVRNVRTFNIIQWSMQIIAVLLIYLSSEYREMSTAIILVLIGMRAIPSRWILKVQQIWYRFFPPKVRVLTELEYIEQGNIETRKALEDLRKYCSSPDCNVWKTVTRLKEPLKFAQFIETGSHCSDEELLQYNSESPDEYDDEADSDNEQAYNSHFGNGYRNHS